MIKEFDNITDFFYYICNLDSENHATPSISEVYGALRVLTKNFNADCCEGALSDLESFREKMKPILQLMENVKEYDFTNVLSQNKQAVRKLYLDNQGILTVELDVTRMDEAAHSIPLFSLISIAIKERYGSLSFDLLDKVQNKLIVERDNSAAKESTNIDLTWLLTDFRDLTLDTISDGFNLLLQKKYIVKTKGSSKYKLNLCKKSVKVKVSYFIKKLYKPTERIPWSKWEMILSTNGLGKSYNQIRDRDREWQKDIDKLIESIKRQK